MVVLFFFLVRCLILYGNLRVWWLENFGFFWVEGYVFLRLKICLCYRWVVVFVGSSLDLFVNGEGFLEFKEI